MKMFFKQPIRRDRKVMFTQVYDRNRFGQESELDELSWKIIHGQHLTAEQHNRYYELWIKEKAEREVAIKNLLEVGSITPQ